MTTTDNRLATADTYQPMRAGAAALADVLERTRDVPVFAAIVNDDDGAGRPGVVLDVLWHEDGVRAAAALGLTRSLTTDGGFGTDWRGTIRAAGAPTDVIVRAYSEGISSRRAVVTLVRLLVAAVLIVPAALAVGHMVAEAGGVVAVAIAWVGWIIAPSSVASVRASLHTLRRPIHRRGGAR